MNKHPKDVPMLEYPEDKTRPRFIETRIRRDGGPYVALRLSVFAAKEIAFQILDHCEHIARLEANQPTEPSNEPR